LQEDINAYKAAKESTIVEQDVISIDFPEFPYYWFSFNWQKYVDFWFDQNLKMECK